MPTLGLNELKQIVELGGRELEREDRYIAGCFAGNSAYSAHGPEWFPGIWYMRHEPYFQRVTVRALLSSFPFRVELEEPGPERKKFDVGIYCGNSAEPVAVGEMKVVDKRDISADAAIVRPDIEKLKPLPWGQFVLLFALNERGNTDFWIEQLKEQAGIFPACELPRYTFPTEVHWANDQQCDWEFGVIGILLKGGQATG